MEATVYVAFLSVFSGRKIPPDEEHFKKDLFAQELFAQEPLEQKPLERELLFRRSGLFCLFGC
ncbi:hypothetical protein AALB39_16060 [Lachnospiraceae bacterium 54-53]